MTTSQKKRDGRLVIGVDTKSHTPIRCLCPELGEHMPIRGECDGCFFAGDCIERYEYLHPELVLE
jgi:hypothetical protein